MDSTDNTVSVLRANVLAALLMPLPVVVLNGLHYAMWGWPSYDPVTLLNLLYWLLLIGIVSAGVHELLHAIGFWYAGRTPWKQIRFGIHWSLFTPYASTTASMRARGYRIAAALPGIVLGIVPGVMGLASGFYPLTWYAVIMLIAASGDAVALWAMRRVSDEAIVRDAPQRIGCVVVAPAAVRRPGMGTATESAGIAAIQDHR